MKHFGFVATKARVLIEEAGKEIIKSCEEAVIEGLEARI